MGMTFSPSDSTLYRNQTYTFTLTISPTNYQITALNTWIYFYNANNEVIWGPSQDIYDEEPFTWTRIFTFNNITVPNDAVRATFGCNTTDSGSWVGDTKSYNIISQVVLTPPGNPTITQNGSYASASWTAATGSGGSGSITYDLIYSIESEFVWRGTATSCTFKITDLQRFGTTERYFVAAEYSGKSASSDYTTFTPTAPSMSATINITQAAKSKTVSISWGSTKNHFSSSSVTYTVKCAGVTIYTGTNTSMTYTPPSYGQSLTYTVSAVTTTPFSEQFSATASKNFTATAPYYTVGAYVDNAWKPCIAYVYVNGSGWTECHPYAYYNGEWKLCDYS